MSCLHQVPVDGLSEAAHMLCPRAGGILKEANPSSVPGPHVGTSGSPALVPVTFPDAPGSPVVSLTPNSTSSSVAISHDSAGSSHRLSAESGIVNTEIGKDIDLLADPTDGLMLSPDLGDNEDNQTGPMNFLVGSHHELPEDPLEGLCIPSWQELLDEAVSQFPPEEPIRNHPSNSEVVPNACQFPQGSLKGCSWHFPALSESPAQKRRKPGDCGATQGSTRPLSWDHLQDQRQISSIGSQRSTACDMAASYTFEKPGSAVQSADVQSNAPTPSAEHGSCSDTLNQDLQKMMMMEISSAVESQQAKQAQLQPKMAQLQPKTAQLQPKTAAVQKRRGGPAKHAKRAGASCKGQGKRTAASQLQGKRNAPALGQSQGHHVGQDQGQRPQGASLGRLLPFDSVQVSSGGKSCTCGCGTCKEALVELSTALPGLKLFPSGKLCPSAKLCLFLPVHTWADQCRAIGNAKLFIPTFNRLSLTNISQQQFSL